jgi:hypothetical protein
MHRPRSGFVNAGELKRQVSVEQVAAFYGASLPELHRLGSEVRTACFLACGKAQATGPRALAIKADTDDKHWKCHQYGCPHGGDIIEMCALMKFGEPKPRGDNFKAILQDLQAIIGGETFGEVSAKTATPTQPKKNELPPVNAPLKQSDNERARELVDLDEKFLTDPDEMSAAAASYFRQRPYLTPEVCRTWRMGYLPSNAGADKRGGTMRGKVCYALLDEAGEVLTWFGRDAAFEEKHARWIAGGRQGEEPRKTNFVKGFQRGLELYGQHQLVSCDDEQRERLEQTGLVVVEGPNDVIALSALGQPAVGLCSNTISDAQVQKLVDAVYFQLLFHNLGDSASRDASLTNTNPPSTHAM